MTAAPTYGQRIIAHFRAGLDPFDGFSDAERADYAETVRIENEVRAERERETEAEPAPIAQPSIVPYVEVACETAYGHTLRFSRAIRVF